nr:hypothetical protein [Propionivibrio sp.]
MKELYSPRLFLAAAALSFGLAANAQAMPRGEQPGPGIGMPGHHAMMHDRALNRLHDELKLDATQEAQWKEAEKFSRDHRTTMRERFQKERAEIKAMLDQPGADL